ncbi:MAG: Rpn family recombination-promoting nuclease/putative transposase, partial [Bacteroidales bacterium]|nr:Rpn family recombination-promoting nuclease/putative transposase [Bacteroidales bacterium]
IMKTKKGKVPERDPLGRTFVNLCEDSGFKAVYADPENKRQLIDMLNVILPKHSQVTDIVEYRDRERDPDYKFGKKTILDLCVTGQDGTMFDIEIQNEIDPNFFERMIYYAADDYHSQLLKTQQYSELHPVHMVVITPGILWHEQVEASLEGPVKHLGLEKDNDMKGCDLLPDRVVTRYVMKEEETNIFAPSGIFCNFAQLGRFHKRIEDCTTKEDLLFYWFLHSWMYSDSPSKIENDPEIKRLAYATRVANFTQEKYRKYKRDMRNERDIRYKCEINFNNGLLKGREEGREEGRDEERIVIARNCKAMGMDIASIAKVTGLSEAEIANL